MNQLLVLNQTSESHIFACISCTYKVNMHINWTLKWNIWIYHLSYNRYITTNLILVLWKKYNLKHSMVSSVWCWRWRYTAFEEHDSGYYGNRINVAIFVSAHVNPASRVAYFTHVSLLPRYTHSAGYKCSQANWVTSLPTTVIREYNKMLLLYTIQTYLKAR